MRMTINARNMELTDKLKEQIEKQVNKLNKYLHDDAEVQVKLSQAKGARNTAEITIIFDRNILRAEETTNEMSLSIDKVSDKIIRQIRRHRTKLEKKLRAGAFEVEAEPEVAVEEQITYDTEPVRIKTFTLRPMTVEDAIIQMDMLGHSFFLFYNSETNSTCVVYSRQDGRYGLLAPDNI